MNKFLKLSLFLSATCLIASSLLAATVALTDPIIAKHKEEVLAKAYENLYPDQKVSIVKNYEVSEKQEEKNILEITKVNHDQVDSMVYKVRSVSSYEKLTFFVGIDMKTSKVDSYYFIESSASSLGFGNFKESEVISSKYEGYDGSSSVIVTGTTVTSKAVKVAVDTAISDFKAGKWDN